MTTTSNKSGWIEIKNYPSLKPFLVVYEDLDNAIQVDVTGIGLLQFSGKVTPDLEVEIHYLINQALTKYGDLTQHDASSIGYNLELTQTKRLNRKYSTYETGISLTIVFEKPVQGASSSQLEPTIELITATIIGEIFILGDRW